MQRCLCRLHNECLRVLARAWPISRREWPLPLRKRARTQSGKVHTMPPKWLMKCATAAGEHSEENLKERGRERERERWSESAKGYDGQLHFQDTQEGASSHSQIDAALSVFCGFPLSSPVYCSLALSSFSSSSI